MVRETSTDNDFKIQGFKSNKKNCVCFMIFPAELRPASASLSEVVEPGFATKY